MTLTGKTAFITGAAGNLGLAVARAMGQAGAGLVVTDLRQDRLTLLYRDMPNCIAVAADLADPAALRQAVAEGVARFGGLDLVCNIAGGFTMGPALHETDPADWDKMMNLNARSVFYVCRAAVPILLARGGGRIVNVAARAALEGKAHMGPYCASKAAVVTLTQTLSAELKDRNINVNCILPGTIDTPENRAAMPDADTNRWVKPEALADVVLQLCSDEARAITGAAVPVYGRG